MATDSQARRWNAVRPLFPPFILPPFAGLRGERGYIRPSISLQPNVTDLAMNQSRLLIMLLPFCLLPLLAQQMGAQPAASPVSVPFNSAWFGTVGAGLTAHDNGAFSRRLASFVPAKPDGEPYLYQNSEFFETGTILTAGGGLLFGERYLVGGSGEMVRYPESQSIMPPGSPRDQYILRGGGGGLDFGYAVVNDGQTLVFPYLQGGYYGYTLEYHNNQSDSLPFFEGNPVAPGGVGTYTGAAPRVAIGVGLVHFLGSAEADGSRSGFVVAARLTWGVMPSRPSWEQDGKPVNNGGLTPAWNGVSFGISIGGGGGGK